MHLSCAHSGSASPLTRWFFQGKEATWVNQASLYGRSQLKIESVKQEDSGNYTCVIENTELLDSISYNLRVQGTVIQWSFFHLIKHLKHLTFIDGYFKEQFSVLRVLNIHDGA